MTREPERGQSEGSHNLEATSYKEDLVGLYRFQNYNFHFKIGQSSLLIELVFFFVCTEIAKNPSFMLSTAGFTCVAFVTGALAWWGPKFMYLGLKLQPGNEGVTLNE